MHLAPPPDDRHHTRQSAADMHMTGGGTGRYPQDAPGASSRVESNISTEHSRQGVVGGRRLRGDGEACER